MSSPVQVILSVPGPSGLNDARQNSPFVSCVVGSPAPKRYADKQAAGPALDCVIAPPRIGSTVASGPDGSIDHPIADAANSESRGVTGWSAGMADAGAAVGEGEFEVGIGEEFDAHVAAVDEVVVTVAEQSHVVDRCGAVVLPVEEVVAVAP